VSWTQATSYGGKRRNTYSQEIVQEEDDIGGEARTQTSAVEKIPRPAIVELFRSQGCSACPPAEALLARFEEQQLAEGREIAALKERVDCWNQ
jgi:hypothetical protein